MAYLHHIAATRAPRTLQIYARRLQRLLDWKPKLTAKDLTRTLLMDWHRWLRETPSAYHGKGLSIVSANNFVRTVGGLWRWAWEYSDEQDWEGLIPQPRRPELPKEPAPSVVAPTWAEMDDVIARLDRVQAYQRLAVVLRCTGMRISAAAHLQWESVDLGRARLVIPADITKGSYGGRTVPMAPVLVDEMAGWGRREGYVVALQEDDRARFRNEDKRDPRPRRALRKAWQRSIARPEAYRQSPGHAFRRGFLSELTRVGVEREVTEVLEGRGVEGSRARYLDDVARWPAMVAAVGLVPPLGGEVIQLEARRDRAVTP